MIKTIGNWYRTLVAYSRPDRREVDVASLADAPGLRGAVLDVRDREAIRPLAGPRVRDRA